MNIHVLSECNEKKWDEFVDFSLRGSLFHTIKWRRILDRTFSYSSHFLVASEGDVVCGVFPLYLVPKPLGGRIGVSVPFGVYGGILAEEEEARKGLLQAAQALADEKKLNSLEFRQEKKIDDSLPTKDLYFTFMREIFDGEEKNMAAIPRKQRRMIRQGIGFGLQSKIGGREFLRDFYVVYSSSLRNLGTPVFPYRYFENLVRELGDACKILTVEYQGKVVAAVLTFFWRDRVMPYYGGGLAEYQRYAIYDFMYWELMRYGWEHGYTMYDFGRSKADTGPFHFKRHWGFEPLPLPYQYYLPQGGEMPNLNPLNPKLQPFIAIWKRLPLPVANALGPFLIKYLP